MIEVKKYTEKDKNLWDDFIEKSKNGTFMLKRDYMDYHSDRFEDFSLMFFQEEKLIALMPASLHGRELRSHGGLTYGGIISDSSMKSAKMLVCFEELKKFLKNHNIEKLIYKKAPYIYSSLPSDEDLYALFRNNARLFRRDVSSTIDLQNPVKMPKGRKAQISRAKREGVLVEESFDFDSFIELENKVLEKNHNTKAVHSADEICLLHSKFPDNIRLFVAKYDDKIIAATLVFIYDNLIHTQYMVADETSREIGALDLLIKTLIDKYSESKKYFDFGISTEDNGNVLNEGLIYQKEGFGARAVMYDFYEMMIP